MSSDVITGYDEVMSNVAQSDAMNTDAFNALWSNIADTWEKIYTMLTSVKVAGIPLFWWFVTFTAISVLWIVITNLSLGDASVSSVLGFGKSESQNSYQRYRDNQNRMREYKQRYRNENKK